MKNYSVLRSSLFTVLAGASLTTAAFAATTDPFADPYPHPQAKAHVVIQVDRKDPLSEKLALHNTANLLKYFGKNNVQAEVVAYGPGIDLLLKKNKNADAVKKLTRQGVMFAACENTMHALHITRSQLNSDAHPVPSGAVAIIKREQQGWAYVRP